MQDVHDDEAEFRVFHIQGEGIETNDPGWYWVPKGERQPYGPFPTERAAEADARDEMGTEARRVG